MRRLILAIFFSPVIFMSTLSYGQQNTEADLIQETVTLVKEVKEFEKTLGIKPTEALSQSYEQKPATSMLWLWLQKIGTIALHTPMDARIGVRFGSTREELPLQTLYKTGKYSVYYRQGNEFSDPHAVTTADFSKQSALTRVMIILHEDLHGNFALPWETEESLVTPLGLIAALRFFEYKADDIDVREAQSAIQERSKLAQELNEIVHDAELLFRTRPLDDARAKLIERVRSSNVYGRWYKFQTENQDDDIALEAKISHDLAYYKYFARIASLDRRMGDLKMLIQALKIIPRSMDMEEVEKYMRELEGRYE